MILITFLTKINYHQIDKQAVQSTDEITFLHSNNIRLEIIEKDPLIAWHITETSDKTSIAYELDKEIEEVEKHLTTVTEVGEISENSDSKFVAILPLLLIPILGVTLIGFARFARKK